MVLEQNVHHVCPQGGPILSNGSCGRVGRGQGSLNETQPGQPNGSKEEKPYICDGLLCFLFSIPCVPAGIFHLALELHEVCLQLLLGVDEASVLAPEEQMLPRQI